jgi:hypothetical protein
MPLKTRNQARIPARTRRVLTVQDLADQVVGDGPVVPGERGDESARVGVVLQRQAGQPQSGGPPLRPPPQRRDLCIRQCRAEGGDQLGGLGTTERQLVGAYLGQATGHPQSCQPQGRVRPRHEDHPELRRGSSEQELDIGQDRCVGQLMEIVQHEHHRARQVAKAVDQQRDERFAGARGGQVGQAAVGWDRAAGTQASQIVFPVPAGAASSMSGPCAPSVSASSSRGRVTNHSGGWGTISLVASSGSSANPGSVDRSS